MPISRLSSSLLPLLLCRPTVSSSTLSLYGSPIYSSSSVVSCCCCEWLLCGALCWLQCCGLVGGLCVLQQRVLHSGWVVVVWNAHYVVGVRLSLCACSSGRRVEWLLLVGLSDPALFPCSRTVHASVHRVACEQSARSYMATVAAASHLASSIGAPCVHSRCCRSERVFR